MKTIKNATGPYGRAHAALTRSAAEVSMACRALAEMNAALTDAGAEALASEARAILQLAARVLDRAEPRKGHTHEKRIRKVLGYTYP